MRTSWVLTVLRTVNGWLLFMGLMVLRVMRGFVRVRRILRVRASASVNNKRVIRILRVVKDSFLISLRRIGLLIRWISRVRGVVWGLLRVWRYGELDGCFFAVVFGWSRASIFVFFGVCFESVLLLFER